MDALSKMKFMIRAVKDYEDGASIRELSDTYQVPYTTVRYVLLKHGVKLRGVGNARRDKHFRYRTTGRETQ